MSQPAKVQEPSMEEILASIRRIIADDETKAPAATQPPLAKPAPAAAATAKPAPVAGTAGPSAMTSQSANE
jgi:cell pole-organizing protein PopZ